MKLYGICLSPSDLFHLVWCPQVPSMLSEMARNYLFYSAIHLDRYMHPYVHCSITYESQDAETTEVLADG